MPELSAKEYLDYLFSAYSKKGKDYYRQFLTVPLVDGIDILDWGCGLGGMLELLATLAPHARLHGLDMNPECVQHVKEAHPDWKIERLPLPGTISTLSEQSFDRIFLLDVVEHCGDPLRLLNECYRLLKPGGILTLSTPDRLGYHKHGAPGLPNFWFNIKHLAGKEWLDPTHVTEYSVWELRKLLEESQFQKHDLSQSFWHWIPWLRPPKKFYSFTVNVYRK